MSHNAQFAARRAVVCAGLLVLLAGMPGKVMGATAPTMVFDLPGGQLNPTQLVFVGHTLYFSADDGSSGRELWKSDGTSSGTKRVKDIRPGSNGSNPLELVNIGGLLLFTANDGTHGRELWKTNGTAAGTKLLNDIRTGSGTSDPGDLTAAGGLVFFSAKNGAQGRELWKSNGTPAGTAIVENIRPGSASSNPSEITGAGDVVFFAADDGANGRQLWISDGTPPGTHIAGLAGPSPSTDPGWLTHVADGPTVDFRSFGLERIYRYDDETGTYTIISVTNEAGPAHHLTNVNGKLFFFGVDQSLGHAIYSYTGPTPYFEWALLGLPEFFGPFTDPASVGSRIFFAISDGTHPHAIWKSNGTTAGTKQVEGDDPAESYPEHLTAFHGDLYFSAIDVCVTECGSNDELWMSDGTAAGTKRVAEINPSPMIGSAPQWLTPANGTLYFAANDGTHGYELWRYVP